MAIVKRLPPRKGGATTEPRDALEGRTLALGGCDVRGAGTLPDPVRIHYCDTHQRAAAPSPTTSQELRVWLERVVQVFYVGEIADVLADVCEAEAGAEAEVNMSMRWRLVVPLLRRLASNANAKRLIRPASRVAR